MAKFLAPRSIDGLSPNRVSTNDVVDGQLPAQDESGREGFSRSINTRLDKDHYISDCFRSSDGQQTKASQWSEIEGPLQSQQAEHDRPHNQIEGASYAHHGLCSEQIRTLEADDPDPGEDSHPSSLKNTSVEIPSAILPSGFSNWAAVQYAQLHLASSNENPGHTDHHVEPGASSYSDTVNERSHNDDDNDHLDPGQGEGEHVWPHCHFQGERILSPDRSRCHDKLPTWRTRTCPLNCDQEHFHRVLPTLAVRADDADPRLNDDNVSGFQREAQSLLEDLAIATSLRDLWLAMFSAVPFVSTYLWPSCLVRLVDVQSDLLGFDHALLYFDQSLGAPLPAMFPPCIFPSQPVEPRHERAAVVEGHEPNQQESCQPPDDIETVSVRQRPVLQADESTALPGDGQHAGHDDIVAMTRSPPSEPESERPALSPIENLSSAESDEPIKSPRKRKLEKGGTDEKPEAVRAPRKTKKVEQHICEICGKQFGRRFGLQMHWRTHSGERPYQCDICEKRFAHQSHLNRHVRTHTGERRHACLICNRRFTENGSVARHVKRRHPDVNLAEIIATTL